METSIDHNGWPDRPRIQNQIGMLGMNDYMHIFNVLDAELTPEQKARVFARWCPAPSDEEIEQKYSRMYDDLVSEGMDPKDVEQPLREVRARLEVKRQEAEAAVEAERAATIELERQIAEAALKQSEAGDPVGEAQE